MTGASEEGRSDRAWSVRLAVSLLAFLAALATAEGAARLWLARLASPDAVRRYATFAEIEGARNLLLEPHPYLPFVPRANYREGPNRHNALGFRGDEIAAPKPAGVFRIALLGGSTTYTARVKDYRKSFPYLLQERLRARGHPEVEVVNAGVNAYSSWESLLNLELRVLDLEPDLVGVYHGINDVHARIVHPPERYRGDNSGSRAPYAAKVRRDSAWDASVLLRIVRTDLGRRDPDRGFAETDRGGDANHAFELSRQFLAGSYPSGLFAEHPAEDLLAACPPVYFGRNLRNMLGVCREHGIRFFFATYKYVGVGLPTTPAYAGALDEQNELVRALASSTGAPLLDLARTMPDGPGLFADGGHVNAKGAALKARIYADFLIEAGLLPE